MVVKANTATATATNPSPKWPSVPPNALDTSAVAGASVSIRPLLRSITPPVSTTSAVTVHITTVSTNTWRMLHIPCSTGSETSVVACTATEEPIPASLEKVPRRNPQVITCRSVTPPPAPHRAEGVKA